MVTVEHIAFRAAKQRGTGSFHDLQQGVVDRALRDGTADCVRPGYGDAACQDVLEHGMSGKIQQDLSGQARRGHAGLNNDDGFSHARPIGVR